MSNPNYIRTISASISTANTDTLLYTVPANHTFVSFAKSISESSGSGDDQTNPVSAVFKERSGSGGGSVFATVDSRKRQNVKEMFAGGVSIYVNSSDESVTASMIGILFDESMAPVAP